LILHKQIKLNVRSLISIPSHFRYKLIITGADETDNTKFIMFGWIAQHLIKRMADTLIANNPPGFIPDEITRLLEKVYTFNVSFTENTISSWIVSFHVNTIVAEIDDGTPLLLTPLGSQSSSVLHSQDASSSIQDTPQKDSTTPLEVAGTPQSNKNYDKNKVQ
jgi:replication factor A1